MKPEITIRAQLGLKQQEMAELLGISRGQWSMFESGKRNLPLHATQRLAELLSLQQSTNKKVQKAKQPEPSEKILNDFLRENQYQRLLTERKISALQRKHDKIQKLTQFSASLQKNDSAKAPHIDSILRKASKVSGTDRGEELSKLKLKLEILDNEKQFLEAALKTSQSKI